MGNISTWNKFCLLLWKNWRVQRRRKMELFGLIFAPVISTLFLIILRLAIGTEIKEELVYNPVPIDSLNYLRAAMNTTITSNVIESWRLAYSPENQYLEEIIAGAANKLNLGIRPCIDRDGLLNELYSSKAVAAIEFPSQYYSLKDYPKKLIYAIKFPSELRTSSRHSWLTNHLFPLARNSYVRNPDDADGGVPPAYVREGFAAIQNAIFESYYSLINGKELPLKIILRRFPHQKFEFDKLNPIVQKPLSLVIILAYLYPCTTVVKYITAEKENQLKEIMVILGINSCLHWSAWFVKSFSTYFISVCLTVFLLTQQYLSDSEATILSNTHWTILIFFLMLYSVTAIFFSFMMSSFSSKSNTASAMTAVLWFISMVPYDSSSRYFDSLSLTTKYLIGIFPNSALGIGFAILLKHQVAEKLTWSNLMEVASEYDNIHLGHVFTMFVMQWFLFLCTALYMEEIMPKPFGVARKWYFLCTKEFYFGKRMYMKKPKTSEKKSKKELLKKKRITQTAGNENLKSRTTVQRSESIRGKEFTDFDEFDSEDDESGRAPSQNIQYIDDKSKHIGIDIRDLRKKYSADKVAVKGLSLKLYENEITVLLGHNGAGKTTTISMITGVMTPSSGTAYLNGYDIRRHPEKARQHLGFCPQHNILFKDLTVEEHLIFYCSIKGFKKQELREEVYRYLRNLELLDKTFTRAKDLSGGMKRKLSVGLALCGGSTVVLLDEPTAGMDPSARRAMWDLLQTQKLGRTILLSTHFMDEADVLGDRIAIMSNGQLMCHGTTFFLKKRFGVGYHMVLAKDPNCNVAKVTELLQKYIPTIVVESDIGTELSYQLNEEYRHLFEGMLKDMEDNMEELGITGYGISGTSIEEVFMAIGKEASPPQTKLNLALQKISSIKGRHLVWNQANALFFKKLLIFFRNPLLTLIHIIVPIFLLIMPIIDLRQLTYVNGLPSLQIDQNTYKNFVSITDYSLRSNESGSSFETNVLEEYRNLLPHESKFLILPNKTIIDFMLKEFDSNNQKMLETYLVGISIKSDSITGWFNNEAYHSIPLTLNLVHVAALRAGIQEANKNESSSAYNIVLQNAPGPFSPNVVSRQITEVTDISISGTTVSMVIAFCMTLVASFFIRFIIDEKNSRAKLLQHLSGAKIWVYWLSTIIMDILVYVLSILTIILVLFAFEIDGLSKPLENLAYIFGILILFAFMILPFIYYMARFFSDPVSGYCALGALGIFGGMICFIIITTLRLAGKNKTADSTSSFLIVFPHYALSQALENLYRNNIRRSLCKMLCKKDCVVKELCRIYSPCCPIPYLDFKDSIGIGRHLVIISCFGIISTIILFLAEYSVFQRIMNKSYNAANKYKLMDLSKNFKISSKREEPISGDDDVVHEKQFVSSLTAKARKNYNLVVDCAVKYYGYFRAVNCISVAVKGGECFGLLGLNGAGKTTSFKMMTGDESITSGHIYIKGIDIGVNLTKVYSEIGYCPQFDALFEDLTGRENMHLFSLLRGISKRRIKPLSESLAYTFGFKRHIDKIVRKYSGGSKRKLSAAIAMIGSPSIIYLDEPTNGIDPAGRRQFWNVVISVRESGKSIVLTSHSMEECEALCSRLAIMVNGEFKCLGSPQHLKNKFSKGFVLKIKLLSEDYINLVKEFVTANFAQAEAVSKYEGLLTFYIPSKMHWSYVFGILEKNKNDLYIEDYSISQTTLEEIFLDFARDQMGEHKETNLHLKKR